MFRFLLASRYLMKRPISWLAAISVVLAVFVVIVVMTIMNGLSNQFREKNHRYAGDCVISSDSLVGFPYYEQFKKQLLQQDYVRAVAPVVLNYAMIDGKRIRAEGVEVIGVEPVSYSEVSGFSKTLYMNAVDSRDVFVYPHRKDVDGCILGIALRNNRNEQGEYDHMFSSADVTLTCFPLTAKGTLQKAGTDIASTKTFVIANECQTGISRVDYMSVYVSLENAQLLCGMSGATKRVSELRIKFKDGVKSEDASEKVKALWKVFVESKSSDRHSSLLQAVKVQHWLVYRRSAIAPMDKERSMMASAFMLIGLVTIFIIFVVFFMIVNNKQKDMGILKSMGVSTEGITRIFVMFSVMIAIVSSFVGASAGLLFLYKINDLEDWLYQKYEWQLWNRAMYNIGDIPSHVSLELLIVIIACAIGACVVGAALPAFQAARRKPVDILKVDEL